MVNTIIYISIIVNITLYLELVKPTLRPVVILQMTYFNLWVENILVELSLYNGEIYLYSFMIITFGRSYY